MINLGPTVAYKFAKFEWEILQGKVYKNRHSIADLELSTTPLTNGCRNDDIINLGPQVAVSVCSDE